jgi:hypothetical protein
MLHFTACFDFFGHHQLYKVGLKSFSAFLRDVLYLSRFFVQFVLCHAFLFNHMFDVCLLNMLFSFLSDVHLHCLVLH